MLDFGNASKVGERKGAAPYKPIGTEREKVIQNPVSILCQTNSSGIRQDIHMELINTYKNRPIKQSRMK